VRTRAARKAQRDEFPMNLRGVCGFFEDFSKLFAHQKRTSENSYSTHFGE
jgi:hypothetical protein